MNCVCTRGTGFLAADNISTQAIVLGGNVICGLFYFQPVVPVASFVLVVSFASFVIVACAFSSGCRCVLQLRLQSAGCSCGYSSGLRKEKRYICLGTAMKKERRRSIV